MVPHGSATRLLVSLIVTLSVGACSDQAPITEPPQPAGQSGQHVIRPRIQVASSACEPAFVGDGSVNSMQVSDPCTPESDDYSIAYTAFSTGERVRESDLLPLWQGESFTVEAAQSVCPAVILATIRVLKDGTWYKFSGPLSLWGPASPGSIVPNLPHAYYRSSAPVYSDNGATQLLGELNAPPLAYVACQGRYYVSVWRVSAWLGGIFGLGAVGREVLSTGGNGSEPHDGWAYIQRDGYEVSVENGVGDGWEAALDSYLAGGGCSEGWQIWVDGEQRCDGLNVI